MAGNSNYATLATTTLSNFANEIFDNVVTNNALLNELQKKGNILVVSGGREFTHPVFCNKNTSFAAMGKYGTVNTDLMDPLTRSRWDIKVLAGSVVYSLVEEAMNAGNREKLIDYVEAMKMSAEVSMGELMGDQLFTAQASVGTNDLDSIPKIISKTPSTQSDVGGIESSTTSNAFWRNYTYATTVGSFNSLSGSVSIGLTAMDAALNGCTYGRQGPTLIITTKSIYGLYQTGQTPNIRYASIEKADAGFKSLQYATIPVMFDDNCPSGSMFFINTNSIRLQVLSQGNMKMTSFVQAYNQLMARSILHILCNVTCGDRRTQGIINSITG